MYPSHDEPNFGVFVRNVFNQMENNGLDVSKVVIDKNKVSFFYKLLAYFKFYASILFSLGKFETYYIHFVSHSSLPFLILDLMGFKFNLVSHVHGGDVKLLSGYSGTQFKLKKLIVQRTLDISTNIIVPSQAYACYLLENYTTDKEKISIYPSGGVDTRMFNNSKSISVEKGLVGYAGRLIKSKNVDVIIKAIELVPEAKLEILGEGPEEENLKKLVSERNLSSRVSFLPSASQSDLAKWYNRMDVLVYPSESESLGLVPIEAISCNTKAVLSNIPAFQEFKCNGIKFEMPEFLDSVQYSVAINKLLELSDVESRQLYEHNLKIIDTTYSATSTFEVLKNAFQ